jgi:hypothetical protein
MGSDNEGQPAVTRQRATPRYRVRWQHFTTPWFRYLMHAPDEMPRLVEGSGWRVARIIDDGSPRHGIVLERA